MRIFITGGTGFIGKFVVRQLQRTNHSLLVLTKKEISVVTLFGNAKNIQLLHGNLRRIKRLEPMLRKFHPDIAIHLAWEGIPDYGLDQSLKNLAYGVNLIEMLGQVGCKMFVGAGSCWECGVATGKINEKVIHKSSNPFTSAKLSLRLFGEHIAAKYGMKFIWMRFFYAYGPGQKKTSLVPSLIQSVEEGKVPEIKNPHGGNDFIYVEDVASAIIQVVRKYATISAGVYNVGSGHLTGVQQIMETVMKNCGVKFKPIKIKPTGFYADISKLIKATGWRPKTGIEQGIKKTINYFKAI